MDVISIITQKKILLGKHYSTRKYCQVTFPLIKIGRKYPNCYLLDWLRQERQMSGEEVKVVVWEKSAKKKMQGSRRITSPVLGLSHHSFSCHLCTPLCLESCLFHCQASLFYKTKWTSCCLWQGNILAMTFKSTIFYRHDYHSPFTLMWLVGVMTPSYPIWAIKNCKRQTGMRWENGNSCFRHSLSPATILRLPVQGNRWQEIPDFNWSPKHV